MGVTSPAKHAIRSKPLGGSAVLYTILEECLPDSCKFRQITTAPTGYRLFLGSIRGHSTKQPSRAHIAIYLILGDEVANRL